jgi:hypothetical protein
MLLDICSESDSDMEMTEPTFLCNMSKRRKPFWRSKYMAKKIFFVFM